MKSLLVVAMIALAFTTGFTCSKNTPAEQPAQQEAAPAQEQMAAPAETAPADAPAEGAAPTETPAPETK